MGTSRRRPSLRRPGRRLAWVLFAVAACGARDSLFGADEFASGSGGAGHGGSAAGAAGTAKGGGAGAPGGRAGNAGRGGAGATGGGGSAGALGGAGTMSGSSGTGGQGCLSPGAAGAQTVRFAAIGDYGHSGPNEAAVATLVKSFSPDFIVTTGDNNYPNGAAETIDANIGQYYAEFICPYRGDYGPGSAVNRFFPALGNHDWYTANAAAYVDYFALPGNERYYDVVWGPVHLFAVDSDPSEPDGVTMDSAQAAWLRAGLTASRARWQVVYMHHPPYSSASHGSTPALQWPYADWGADLVLAGHDHTYERLEVDGLPYIVSGLGGASIYAFGVPIAGSIARYNATYGATFVDAGPTELHAFFVSVNQELVDELWLTD